MYCACMCLGLHVCACVPACMCAGANAWMGVCFHVLLSLCVFGHVYVSTTTHEKVHIASVFKVRLCLYTSSCPLQKMLCTPRLLTC